MNDKVNLAVVGLRQGLEDVYVALNHPRFDVRAVCDIDRAPYDWITGDRVSPTNADPMAAVHRRHSAEIQRSPDAKRLSYVRDYSTLLRCADVDAVAIVVPDALHADYSIAALQAGKYVLCTKPMALSLDSAMNLGVAARAHPRHYMLGFQASYGPFAKTVLDVLAEGVLGSLRQVRFDHHRFPWREAHSHKYADVDGAIIKEGTHWLDLINRINGGRPWQAVAGFSGLDALGASLDFEDNGVLLVDYGDFRAAHTFSYFRKCEQPEQILIVGEHGTLRGSFSQLTLDSDADQRTINVPGHSLPAEYHLGYVEMYDEFAHMVLDDAEPYSGWQTAIENTLLCYASQLAVAENRAVRRRELASLDWRENPGLTDREDADDTQHA